MANILKLLGILGGIVPIILTLIKEFEVPGFGKEKKEAILKAIGIFYDTLAGSSTLPITKEKLLAVADKLIDIVVGLFNLVGLFKHVNP